MSKSIPNLNDPLIKNSAISIACGLGLGIIYFAGKQIFKSETGSSKMSSLSNPISSDISNNDACLDSDAFDGQGYDAAGFHRNGYNREGFNRDGLDFEGFGKNKYNSQGIDRAGKDAHYYISYFWKLYNLKEEAFKQMQAGEYTYALLDARLVLEQSVALVICHALGPDALGDTLLQNLKICEAHHLFGDDSDFMSRLHGVRKICNPNLHSLDNTEHVTINQVYFAVAQVRDLIQIAREAVAA